MACAERQGLWAYASGEVDAPARAALEAHLAGCASCCAELDAVRATRSVLAAAAGQPPKVDWRKADDLVRTAAERKLARLDRPRFMQLAWATSLGAAAIAIAFVALSRPAPSPVAPKVAAREEIPFAPQAVVELSQQARIASGAAEAPLAAGQSVGPGASIVTPEAGRAVVRLPEKSQMRLAAASSVLLKVSSPEEIALSLQRGRISVQASHDAGRRAFKVEADGATVRVVGTVFSVATGEREVEVGVAEGRVEVSLPGGGSQSVGAGERLVIDRATKASRLGDLPAASQSLYEDFGLPLPPPPVRTQAAKPAEPRPASKAPAIAVAPLAPVAPTPAPVPVPLPEPVPVLAPDKPKPPPLQSISVEESYLRRAEGSLESGDCRGFLLGLEEMLETGEDQGGRERARIVRARCFAKGRASVEADREYRRYLDEFPTGQFASEARRAIAH